MLNPSSSDFLYGRREQHSTKWEEMGRGRTDLPKKMLLLPWVINVLQKKRKEKGKEESQPIKDWRKEEKKNRK